jgi:hypothetical protein
VVEGRHLRMRKGSVALEWTVMLEAVVIQRSGLPVRPGSRFSVEVLPARPFVPQQDNPLERPQLLANNSLRVQVH